MVAFVGICLVAMIGSGKADMSPSEAVSMVICFGGAAGACLKVYVTGEHLTATEGFL
jgi:hypothetical protein